MTSPRQKEWEFSERSERTERSERQIEYALCCGQNRRVRQRRIRIGPSVLCRFMQVKSMVARNE